MPGVKSKIIHKVQNYFFLLDHSQRDDVVCRGMRAMQRDGIPPFSDGEWNLALVSENHGRVDNSRDWEWQLPRPQKKDQIGRGTRKMDRGSLPCWDGEEVYHVYCSVVVDGCGDEGVIGT